MKTIKQIADEIGVSKQAIFYRIKKPPLSNALQSLMSKENSILMVSFDGEMLIRQAFDAGSVKCFDVKEPSKENDFFDGVISVLQEQLRVKDEQLAEKDRQIEKLTDTIKAQAQSINADRHNELAGTLQMQLTDGANDKPKSRWKKAWLAWRGE
jgi:hypothetical protein